MVWRRFWSSPLWHGIVEVARRRIGRPEDYPQNGEKREEARFSPGGVCLSAKPARTEIMRGMNEDTPSATDEAPLLHEENGELSLPLHSRRSRTAC